MILSNVVNFDKTAFFVPPIISFYLYRYGEEYYTYDITFIAPIIWFLNSLDFKNITDQNLAAINQNLMAKGSLRKLRYSY